MEKDPNGIDNHEPGAKLDEGKTLAAVLGDFSGALMLVAEVGTHGANKYSRGGWQSVEDGFQRYTDAMWRHLLKESKEWIDDDFGLPHAAHMAWNALARLELKIREEEDGIKESDGNERPALRALNRTGAAQLAQYKKQAKGYQGKNGNGTPSPLAYIRGRVEGAPQTGRAYS